MIKRKSTANIFANLEKKGESVVHGSHSLNSSVSAKMLGSKAFQKSKVKDSG